jgi:hypothetical protein
VRAHLLGALSLSRCLTVQFGARPNASSDFSTHLGLSGGNEVNYAGTIRFGNNNSANRGTIIHWTNRSGHYQPPSFLNGRANLPIDLFKPR